jgi:hypothetical protein
MCLVLVVSFMRQLQGRIQDFKLGGALNPDTPVSSPVFVRIKYIKEDKKNSVEHSNSNPLFKISF